MSQPIQLTAQLSLTETNVNTALSVAGLYVAQSGVRYTQNIQSVPTTAGGTAIPLGGLGSGTLGYAMFVNLDATNYVDILSAVSGTALIRLLPGETALFRFTAGITAPAMLAHTGAVAVQYLICEA